jgi:Rps23 Pro-64 3,4-dihydroxylase Tpa1-like proline 4-hydroxylase
VIGTRQLSYIIYMTDPDDPWEIKDGGALELYPLDPSSIQQRPDALGGAQGVPTASPTNCIVPKFNTMLIFRVQPGRSYHSVQEVFSPDKPRISISGWYHGKEPPAGSDRGRVFHSIYSLHCLCSSYFIDKMNE